MLYQEIAGYSTIVNKTNFPSLCSLAYLLTYLVIVVHCSSFITIVINISNNNDVVVLLK